MIYLTAIWARRVDHIDFLSLFRSKPIRSGSKLLRSIESFACLSAGWIIFVTGSSIASSTLWVSFAIFFIVAVDLGSVVYEILLVRNVTTDDTDTVKRVSFRDVSVLAGFSSKIKFFALC